MEYCDALWCANVLLYVILKSAFSISHAPKTLEGQGSQAACHVKPW